MRNTVADKSFMEALEQKWEKVLHGLPSRTQHERYVRKNTAFVLEMQESYLQSLRETDTRSANVGNFQKFVLPILRRVFPSLISNEIASVQPMSGPVGVVFYMDYIYGSTKGTTLAGTTFPNNFDRNYTSEVISGEVLATGDGVAYGGAGAALVVNLAWYPVRPLNAAAGYAVVIRELNSAGATVQEATDNGTGGFTGAVLSGVINYSNGSVTNFKFTNPPAVGNFVRAYYTYNGELSSRIPTMSFDIKQAPVTAETRRVKSIWSQEAVEDLRSQQGLEAETEMVAMNAQNMAYEMDRQVIDDMFQGSTGTVGTFDRAVAGGVAELDHLRGILTTMSTVAAVIHRKTNRAPANFVVTSPDIGALLAQLTTSADFRPSYSSDQTGGTYPTDMIRPMSQHGQSQIYRLGTLQHKMVVYEDPQFTRDMMLLGLKSDSYLDSGYALCPYIPLQITQAFLDPNDMGIRQGMRTRYGRKLTRQEFYGQIRVLNL